MAVEELEEFDNTINIQDEMTDVIRKLKGMFDENLEANQRLAVNISKELRGYLVELNTMIKGRIDSDDVAAAKIWQVTMAVKQYGQAPEVMAGKSEGFARPALGSGAVRRSRCEVPQESTPHDAFSEFDDEPDPAP